MVVCEMFVVVVIFLHLFWALDVFSSVSKFKRLRKRKHQMENGNSSSSFEAGR